MNEMYPPVISIDLGASYTKVAIRPSAKPERMGERNISPALLADQEVLIPSLAMVERGVRTKWEFGDHAAEMEASPQRQIHRNWKAKLFKPTLDGDSVTAIMVAREFMTWLREKLEKTGIKQTAYDVVITLPKFADSDRVMEILTRCMDASGWDTTRVRWATEPYANAIGALSNGQNWVARNRAGDLLLDYGRMYGQDSIFIKRAKESLLWDIGSPIVHIGIIDIGAFSTDFAHISFNTKAAGDGLGKINGESEALGIMDQMDEPIFGYLGERYCFSPQQIRFKYLEKAKRALYAMESTTLPMRDRQPVDLGDKADLEVIVQQGVKFGEDVLRSVVKFFGSQRPDIIFLTGGGSFIKVITKPLVARLADCLEIKEAAILYDSKIPALAPPPSQEGATSESEYLRSWTGQPGNLCRLATALGGASVILQDHHRRRD